MVGNWELGTQEAVAGTSLPWVVSNEHTDPAISQLLCDQLDVGQPKKLELVPFTAPHSYQCAETVAGAVRARSVEGVVSVSTSGSALTARSAEEATIDSMGALSLQGVRRQRHLSAWAECSAETAAKRAAVGLQQPARGSATDEV